jgi:esterase/lipase
MNKIDVVINQRLQGTLMIPSNPKKNAAVLFFHGFGTNKDEINNVFLDLSQKLLENNIGSLRFNFSDTNEFYTIDSLIAEANEAYKFLINQNWVNSNSIGICGFSLGAGIAALISKMHNFKSIVLISPTGNLYHDFKTYLGINNFEKIEQALAPIEIDIGWRKVKLSQNFIKV